MALQSAQSEQQLLYSLRSPTTPLNDKLLQATTALDSSPSSASLPPLVCDWALDVLVKASRITTSDSPIVNPTLWQIVSRTTQATSSTSTSTSLLPVFVSFVNAFALVPVQDSTELLRNAVSTWARLAGGTLRKATADAALDSYEKLLDASALVLSDERAQGKNVAEVAEERKLWEQLVIIWSKSLRAAVLEGGKGGKKVPTHTLALLPKILPLLALLPPTSPIRLTLLQTTQFSLYNLDNLRRGLARETYAAGSSAPSATLTADAELLAALSPLLPSIPTAVYAALPSLTAAYFTALSINSAALFPLPAKATFPTPSAQKSALEVLGLTKRRELAGRWVKGVVELVEWVKLAGGDTMEVDAVPGDGNEREKAVAIAGVLAELEKNDLYRAGAADGWEGVLPSIARGASIRLQQASGEAATFDALIQVLAVAGRLSYDAVETLLPDVLSVLAAIPASSSPSTSSDKFLAQLISHHSRSITLPSLLTLIADALASPSLSTPSSAPTPANNLLTTYASFQRLGQAIGGLGGATGARVAFERLAAPVRLALSPAAASESAAPSDNEDGASPAKKRRLSPAASSPPASLLESVSRARVLSLLLSHLPSPALPALVDSLKSILTDLIEPRLKDFVKLSAAANVSGGETPSKKDGKKRRKSELLTQPPSGEVSMEAKLGGELLELRYTVLERLNREGLLEREGGEKWWVLKDKRRGGLRDVVEQGRAEFVLVAARTLLQHVELEQDASEEARDILKAVLDRVGSASEGSTWSSFLRDIKEDEGPVALWELFSRRWLSLAETAAADAQIEQLVKIVIGGVSHSAATSELSMIAATGRLLRRADFWELPRVQGLLQPALVSLVTLPSLATAAPLLANDIEPKTLASLRSLSTSTLLSTSDLFLSIAATVPLEYLSKTTREQLSDRALALDVWLSASAAGADEADKERVQRELREFVTLLGANVSDLSSVLSRLFGHTLPGARTATLELYGTLVQNALGQLKTSQSASSLVALRAPFGDKPLTDLAKRAKKSGRFEVTTEESAFLLLLETLATSLPDYESVPSAIKDALAAPLKAASKSFDKTLPFATEALSKDGAALFRLGDVLDSTRSLWVVKEWVGAQDSLDSYGTFTELALGSVLSQLASIATYPSASSSLLSLLRLLSYRIQRLRSVASNGEISTTPMETLVACHLAFRQSLPPQAREKLNVNLVQTVSSASQAEYGAALAGVAAFAGVAAAREQSPAALDDVEQALDVALVLLRDGPEGSSRIASASLSDLLRHISLLVEGVDEKAVSGASVVRAYSIAAKFLEGVCGEKPMLLSRLNISNTLSLVTRLLQPSSSSSLLPAPSPTSVGDLFRTLVTTVTHLVRHRKDHVVPLFPLLISAISSFISVLRRAGFGTTGSDVAIDELDVSVALGHRAEREARTTFPSWVWEGGVEAIGRPEARTLGRLLGSLTTKTASQSTKRKKDINVGGAEEGPTTTTSLIAPLSKHAPFLLLTYLRACVHSTCPIPSALRSEMQGGWFEVMDSVGKWEKEALMKGFLGEEEEAERGVLRSMFKVHESTRYHG